MADYTLTLEDSTVTTRPRLELTEYEGESYTVQIFTETSENWYLSNSTNCNVVPTSGASGDTVTITNIFDELDLRVFAIFRGALDSTVQGQTIGALNLLGLNSDYGAEIYNENGDLIIDPTSSLVRFVASGVISSIDSGEIVTIPVTGMSTDGSWEVILGWCINDNTATTDIRFRGMDFSLSIESGYFEVEGRDYTTDNVPWWAVRW